MPVSPILERQTTYPFVRLNEAARRVEERGIEVIDFGTGDPQEPTDPLIREALVAGLRERMGRAAHELAARRTPADTADAYVRAATGVARG